MKNPYQFAWSRSTHAKDDPVKTPTQLCLEACELGRVAIKLAFKANVLALDDTKRWPLSRRMLEIVHRLTEISEELNREDETRRIS